LKTNAALASNIEVIEAAVSSYDGRAQFFLSSGTATGSLEMQEGPQVDVPVMKIDSFIAAHSAVDVGLVKIDIEGHDFEALMGMQGTIEKYQPLILTECRFSPELAAFCAQHAYKVFGSIRDPQTLNMQFLEFISDDFEKEWHKMLFLAPLRLHSKFNEICNLHRF
jgi:hypothetical protein